MVADPLVGGARRTPKAEIMEIRRVEVGEGANWYVQGWRLFVKSPVQWVLLLLAPMIATFALIWVLPRLGPLVVSVLGPVVGAGLYHAARTADAGRAPELSMLFEGFRRNEALTQLLILGVIALAATFAAELIGQRLSSSVFSDIGFGEEELTVPHFGIGSLFALLIMLAIESVIALAFLYAVPLLWFKGVAPVEAIRASFSGSLKNFAPLLVFGLIGGVLTIIAILPMMLGLLLLVPVMFLAMYHGYLSIFGDTEKSTAIRG